MKIFAIGSNFPYEDHTKPGGTAVSIVLYHLLGALAAQGHQVVLQLIHNIWNDREPEPNDREELDKLEALGITSAPPIRADEYLSGLEAENRWNKVKRVLSTLRGTLPPEVFYPSIKLHSVIQQRIQDNKADAVLSLWCPEGIAAAYQCAIPVVDYRGTPDYWAPEIRYQYPDIFTSETSPGTWLTYPAQRLRKLLTKKRLDIYKKVHYEIVNAIDSVAIISNSDIDTYKKRGIKRCVYVPNTWYKTNASIDAQTVKDCLKPPFKIIGHVGYLDRTGSTFGLRFLLTELLPALDHTLDGLDYEVHIIGSGELDASLKPYITHSRLVMRGYVEDLDAELNTSAVMLLLNNVGPYHNSYTRHMMSWASGLCLVVHQNSINAIPEIEHKVNSLAGRTPEEIAAVIRDALTDPALNLKIRKGGQALHAQKFTPHVVAKALSNELEYVTNPNST